MQLTPIGIVHSPFKQASGTPIQPATAGRESRGQVEVYEPFIDGLKDLEGFERIWLLFWCHKAAQAKLITTTYLDKTNPHGLFSCRAPARPNPIGLSCVRLLGVKGGILEVAELDVLDGSPLLDIKPYAPQFDHFEVSRSGWLDKEWQKDGAKQAVADERFER